MSEMFKLKLDAQEFAADTGKVLRGLTITVTEDGVKATIRATDKNGVHVYATYAGQYPDATLNDLLDALLSKSASYLWSVDRWA